MNYHNHFHTQDYHHQNTESINYRGQIQMLIDTLQFVLGRLGSLCKWQTEQQGLKRKKSMIKLFDKNIDNLPTVKIESIQVPVFDSFPTLMDKLQVYRASLPDATQTDTVELLKVQTKTNKQQKQLEQRIGQLQTRTQSLQSDLLEVIGLYKDLL